MMKEEGESSSASTRSVETSANADSSTGTSTCSVAGYDDAALQQSLLLISFRPRYLYIAVFFWISVTGGRFLAPFLEHETGSNDVVVVHGNDNHNASSSSSSSSTGMTAETIGLCLAMQVAISTATGSLGGSWADSREERYPGKGRAQVMAFGVSMASIFFLLHGIRYILPPHHRPDDIAAGSATNTTTTTSATILVEFFSSPSYHFGLRMIIAFFSAFVFPVLDGMTISFLQNHPQLAVEDYGKERLWGAISWAITNMALALLLDWSGGSFFCFYPLSIIAAISVLFTLSFFVKGQLKYGQQRMLQKRNSDINIQNCGDHCVNGGHDDKETTTDYSKNEHKNTLQIEISTVMMLCRLLCGTVYGATFFLCLSILSSGQAVVDSLIFLFFESLGSSYTMMGVTVLLTVLFEIPIFHIAPTLLKRCGSGALLLMATMCYMIRVLGYSVIPQGHIFYVLFLEPMHGITYACSQAASVDMAAHCTRLAKIASSSASTSKSELDATAQGLVSAVRGVGSLFGLAAGGWAMDRLGPRLMYRCSAGLVFVGTVFFAVAAYFNSPVSISYSSSNNNRMSAQPLPQEDPDSIDSKDEHGTMGSYLHKCSDISSETARTSCSSSNSGAADVDDGLEFTQWETKRATATTTDSR